MSFLNCLVTYAYADTFRYPSTHYDTDGGVLHQDLTFVPATITLKYYNRDTILDNRFPEWRKTCEMNRDTMRWIFENWWQRLQQLTGDEQPFIWYRRYDIPSFGSPSYANMIGEWHFSSSDQCIEAQLACLPSMSSRFYRRETEYGGVWVWDPATESYKVDTTVRHDDSLFMAKYGRHKDTGDEIIYDYDWEDLAIYVKITIGRLQLAGWHVTRSAPNFNCRSTVALPDWLSQ
ncbi:MAG: hypothetical protein JNM31_00780 [Flavobacteriales bacterium]|nr:hypothetical protein [Flavobacteriales bacterium]